MCTMNCENLMGLGSYFEDLTSLARFDKFNVYINMLLLTLSLFESIILISLLNKSFLKFLG